MAHGKFATVINCIDGRTQFPALLWMKERFNVDYVDSVTAPGVDKVLSEGLQEEVASIKNKVLVSTGGHHSQVVAIVGHYDCAANPGPKEQHVEQVNKCIEVIKGWQLPVRILGLWIGDTWEVEVIFDSEK
ncbi:MAG: carbonic anhydrase [Bacillota bacterium]|jgi:hypothetical protein